MILSDLIISIGSIHFANLIDNIIGDDESKAFLPVIDNIIFDMNLPIKVLITGTNKGIGN
jgi:hypothetical protein